MTPDAAAQLLGVPLGAPAAAIEAAYRAKARQTHPDRFAGEAGQAGTGPTRVSSQAFIDASEARSVLLALAGEPVTPGQATGPVTVVRAGRRRSPLLLATWVGILLIAAFLSIYGAKLPFTLAEPLVRFAVTIVALVAFAVTGLRGWMVLALVALAATAAVTIFFTSIGALLGMLLMVAPVFGLILMGVETAKRR